MTLSAPYCDVPPGNLSRQLDVREDEVGSNFGAKLQRVLSALGLQNFVSVTLQYVHDHIADQVFVFNDQNLQIILPAGTPVVPGLPRCRAGCEASGSKALTIAGGSIPGGIASMFLKSCWIPLLGMVTEGKR